MDTQLLVYLTLMLLFFSVNSLAIDTGQRQNGFQYRYKAKKWITAFTQKMKRPLQKHRRREIFGR